VPSWQIKVDVVWVDVPVLDDPEAWGAVPLGPEFVLELTFELDPEALGPDSELPDGSVVEDPPAGLPHAEQKTPTPAAVRWMARRSMRLVR
jgi:hypothetical protein